MKNWNRMIGFLCMSITLFTLKVDVFAFTPTYVPSSTQFTDIGQGLQYANLQASSSNESSSTLVSQNVNLLLKEGSNQQVQIVPWGGFKGSSAYPYRWQGMNLIDMAKDFELNNPTYKVLGGVNSVFFSMPTSSDQDYLPIDAFAVNQNVYKTSTVTKVFGLDQDNNVILGQSTNEKQMMLSIYDENSSIIKEFKVQKVGSLPNLNEVSVIFDNVTTTINSSQGNIYHVALPEVIKIRTGDYYGLGTITSTPESIEINNAKKSFTLISRNSELNQSLATGTKIRVQYNFTNELKDAIHIQGYHGQILNNGTVPTDYKQMGNPSDLSLYSARNPRTAIGFKADGSILLATVDGRNTTDGKYGMNLQELGYMMKYYGCENAFNFDGGGSTTMIIRDESQSSLFKIVNDYSDAYPRKVTGAMLFVVNEAGSVRPTLKTITQNYATIQVDYQASVGQLTKLTAIYNNNQYEVIDNQITIPYVDEVNYVNFKIDYKVDGQNEVYYEKIPFIFNSLKKAPTIGTITVSDITGNSAKVNYTLLDQDAAFVKASITIDGHEYIGSASSINLYDLSGNTLYQAQIKIEYDTGVAIETITSDSFTFTTLKRLPNESDFTTYYEQVAGKNQVRIYVNFEDPSGYVHKVYVEFQNEKYEVIDHQIIIPNIQFGQTYHYGISYDYYENDELKTIALDIIERFSLTTNYPSDITSSDSVNSSTPSQGGGIGCAQSTHAEANNSFGYTLMIFMGLFILKRFLVKRT